MTSSAERPRPTHRHESALLSPGRWPRQAAMGLIRIYQLTISPLLPADTCRFHPTCSRYGYEAIEKHGLLKGGLMAAYRILRCNPFNPGGFDPVP